MIIGYFNEDRSKIQFKDLTDRNLSEIVADSQKKLEYLRLLTLDYEDSIRLFRIFLALTGTPLSEINEAGIRNSLSLAIFRFKSYLDKFKTITTKKFKMSDSKNPILDYCKTQKYFCLVYNLRNYEQHNGWIISNYEDTKDKPIKVYFDNMVNLRECISAEKWKNIFNAFFPNNDKVNLGYAIREFLKHFQRLNYSMIRNLLFNDPKIIKGFYSLNNLILEIAGNEKEVSIYLLNEFPQKGTMDYRRVIDKKDLKYLINYIVTEMIGKIDISVLDVALDLSNHTLTGNRNFHTGEIIEDQYGIPWQFYSVNRNLISMEIKYTLVYPFSKSHDKEAAINRYIEFLNAGI